MTHSLDQRMGRGCTSTESLFAIWCYFYRQAGMALVHKWQGGWAADILMKSSTIKEQQKLRGIRNPCSL